MKLSDGRWHPQFFHAYIFPLYRGDTPLIGDRSENMVSRKFMGGKKNENKYGVELKFKRKSEFINYFQMVISSQVLLTSSCPEEFSTPIPLMHLFPPSFSFFSSDKNF